MSILGPDYLDDQLIGGPSHDPRRGQSYVQPIADPSAVVEDTPAGTLSTNYEQEVAIAEQFEHGTHRAAPVPLTPSEVLRFKSQYLQSITMLADQFGAKIVDMSDNSVIVEVSGKTTRVDAFLKLIKPFGILESARTGNVVLNIALQSVLMFVQVQWLCLVRPSDRKQTSKQSTLTLVVSTPASFPLVNRNT